MTSKEFKENIIKSGFSVVNEFQNEHGEPYIILDSKWMKGHFIAGSETDWEVMRLHPSGEFAFTEFSFSDKEAATIKQVLDIVKREGVKK